VDFPAIFEIIKGIDFTGWLMAELDETKRTARDSAEIAMRYLKKHWG